jgi:hypothetical protein
MAVIVACLPIGVTAVGVEAAAMCKYRRRCSDQEKGDRGASHRRSLLLQSSGEAGVRTDA